MSAVSPATAERPARLHRTAKAEGAAVRARLDHVQALLLALLAALFGQPAPLALGLRPAHAPRPPQHAPLFDPHGVPGLPTARHRGPVPARAYRLGRFPLWWARNRGARAIPRHAPELRPAKPARAPPGATPIPISRQNTPQPGCASARPQNPAPPGI